QDTVKPIRAARMADDNRMRKSPLDERWPHLTGSQPRVSKMRGIEQANKFELCFEHQSARHWPSTSAHCARRRSDRIKCGCPLLGQSRHWVVRCICLLLTQSRHSLVVSGGLFLQAGSLSGSSPFDGVMSN